MFESRKEKTVIANNGRWAAHPSQPLAVGL